MNQRRAGLESGMTADPKDSATPDSKIRYRVLAFVCLLAVITYIQRLAFSSGAPAIKNSLGLHDEHMGYLAAAFLVAYGLFQVPGGWLGDRMGARVVLTVLVLGWSALTACAALVALLPAVVALQFSALLLVRFLFGACQAGGFPVIGRIVADWMPVTERGFAQGAIWMLSRVGGFLVPFLLVWLFQRFGGWPIPFVLIAGLGVAWCGGFYPWFRNRPKEMVQVNGAELGKIAAGRELGHDPLSQLAPPPVPWSRMAGSRSVWCLCLMYGCTGFSGNFFTSMLPLYLSEHRHLDDQTTAWLSALPLLAGAAACILGGSTSDWLIRRWRSRQWGRRVVGACGLALAGIAFFSANSVEETWLLGLFLTVTFFGNDLTMGPAWASCADIGERFAGTLSGTMNMIGAFAGAGGAALAGYLLRHGRPELIFVLFAGVYLLAALCWLGIDVRKRLIAAD